METIGRGLFIEELWGLLEETSIHLLGERRVGKTKVFETMANNPPQGVLAFYFELEATTTPDAFAQLLYETAAEYLPLGQHAAEEAGRRKPAKVKLGPVETELPSLAGGWQALLDRTMRGLAEQKKYSRVVFFLDELPMMLQEMTEPERRAVLNTLRQLRQLYGKPENKVRMAFTGSIGLHHVLTELHEQGYTNRPTNDMTRKALPPLLEKDARTLAEAWLMTEGLVSSEELTLCIAQQTDGLPFYIREIVRVLRSERFALNQSGVERAIRFLATDASSPIELDDYNRRIDAYYAPMRRPVARALLDTLAREEALSLQEFCSRLLQYPQEDLETTLKLLEEDMYIYYNEDGHFVFRYGFIRRVWLLLRRLG